jgi:hypothetical protein
LQITLVAPLAHDMPADPQCRQRHEPKRKRAAGQQRQQGKEQHDKRDRNRDIALCFEEPLLAIGRHESVSLSALKSFGNL